MCDCPAAQAVRERAEGRTGRAHGGVLQREGLPVCVVQAAVLGVSGHPPGWPVATSISQNPAAAAAAYTSTQQA
jgi:hypothetical protein